MIAWAAEAMAASALLMALVLIARGVVRRVFGARITYLLWALPMARMLLPPLPVWWAVRPASPLAGAGAPMLLVPAPVAPAPVDLVPLVVAIWLIVAALFLAWQIASYVGVRSRVLAGAEPLARSGRVRVVASAGVPGPVAFGILRPTVAVPLGWEARVGRDERDLALAHELAHHARGDLLANWAALLVLALHWFNPLAWPAYRAFRADQEQATDARVLATGASPRGYARCLVAATAGPRLSPACHLSTLTDLKRRLQMLTRPLPTRRRIRMGLAGIAAVAVAGLGLTASSGATERVAAHSPAPPRYRATESTMATMDPMPPMESMAEMPQTPTPPTPPTVSARFASVDRTVTTTTDGTNPPARHYRVITRDKDGRVTTSEGEGTPPGITVPEVRADGCDGGDPGHVVSESARNGRRVIAVCTRRAVAEISQAQRTGQAANARALEGLASARADLLANTGLSPEDRRRAVAAIDGTIASLQPKPATQP